MIELLKKVQELTHYDYKTLTEKALKCSEEVGELAQAVLSYTNACGCGYKGLGVEEVLEESVDVIIVALSIICSIDNGVDNFDAEFDRKMEKWKAKIKERNQ